MIVQCQVSLPYGLRVRATGLINERTVIRGRQHHIFFHRQLVFILIRMTCFSTNGSNVLLMVKMEQSSEICDLVDVFRHFGGMCYLHLQVNHTILRHFPEATKHHTPRKSSSDFETFFLNETKHRAMVNVQKPINYTIAYVYVFNSIIKQYPRWRSRYCYWLHA